MASLLFIVAFIASVFLFVRLLIALFRRQPAGWYIKAITIVLGVYALIWSIFMLLRKEVVVDYGTPVCFDDWCATVTHAALLHPSDSFNIVASPDSKYIMLTILVKSEAKRVDQRPSEPRILLYDSDGTEYTPSPKGMQLLEKIKGSQRPLEDLIHSGEQFETLLVFEVPANSGEMHAMINEGPFITEWLLQGDQMLFPIPAMIAK